VAKSFLTQKLSGLTSLSHETLEELSFATLDYETDQKRQELQQLLTQKEKLELEIRTKTSELQEIRQTTFEAIESALIEKFGTLEPAYQKRLTQLKIQAIDILDLLHEITESAFVAALENGENIEATFTEISRDLTRKTLKDGYLTLDRAQRVVDTIIASAADIAEAAPNFSSEILRGTLYGTKKGLTQSIRAFKERFDYIPDELRPMQIKNMEQTLKDLQHTDRLFIQLVQDQAKLCPASIEKELLYIVERMRPDLSELIMASKDAFTVISKQLAAVRKEAISRGQSVMQSKTAIEAKRMGVNVWDVAKNALNGAISSAKDAMDKKK